ncbi:MAG: ACP phosphodiesterase [Flavobacterium sp.]
MNFLAHIYLSGNDTFRIIGNFMADVVRGNQYLQYPEQVQKGILLHRFIDFYTDQHPVFRQTKHRLHENYGHYSGVITDMYYDYFLAKNWGKFYQDSIEIYANNFYQLLQEHRDLLPDKIQRMSKHMIADNWLVSYQSIQGMQRILYQMDYRTGFKSKMQFATKELQIWENEMEQEFFQFFQDLQQQCTLKIKELESTF